MAKGKRGMKGRSRNMKRRTHRKGTRKSRRMMRGGQLLGSNVGDDTMKVASNLSLQQGQGYSSMHTGQHGGMADFNNNQEFGGALDAGLVESARTGGTLASFHEIAGMKDQGGGGRRKKGKKSRKGSMRKSGTNMRKSRRCWSRKNMRGGMADVGSSDMLLPVDMGKQAVGGMNHEWKLAEDPNSFSPRH